MNTTREERGGHHTTTKATAPLRAVAAVAVSDKHGKELNPRYFWLTWEYTLVLECGHEQVRARIIFSRSGSNPREPETLNPPLPKKVRCGACPSVPSAGRRPRSRPVAEFDPLVGALVAAMARAVPAEQDALIDWAIRHGRHVPDERLRAEAHGAMGLVAIDAYLPAAHPKHAPPVRAALARWAQEPSAQNRVELRRITRRLYHAQHNSGSWYANRGVVDAVKVASKPPSGVRGLLNCLTWDTKTRDAFYGDLASLRRRHDAAREAQADAFHADPVAGASDQHGATADRLWAELRRAYSQGWPVLAEQHMALAADMLAAHRTVIENKSSANPCGTRTDATKTEWSACPASSANPDDNRHDKRTRTR